MQSRATTLSCGLALLAALAAPGRAQSPASAPVENVSLEELMNLEVTSVSRREQPLSQAPSAIYVLSREDIRRSGVTSLPEALRLVPGLQVARIDGNKWAISSRGFNNRFANKMLVVIDGRSVYTPLFSGVYWDLQDTLLEDVERVEIIRGPGATLWGANAVNGVINVITRDAAQTQGGLVTGTFGNIDHATTGVRYGGRLGDRAHYRVFAKFSNRAAFTQESGAPAADATDRLHAGTRVDWKPGLRDSVTLSADVFKGQAGQTISPSSGLPITAATIDSPTDTTGVNVLGRWMRDLGPQSQLTVQWYYDDVRRDDVLVGQEQRNLDFDAQHNWSPGRHQIVSGLGYRRSSDVLRGSEFLDLSPPRRSVNLSSVFVQDEIALVRRRLHVTVGTKLEHNSYTQWELQPGARVAWTPHARHTVWAATSRAVRTPSRAESDVQISFARTPSPTGLLAQPVLFGNPEFQAEVLVARELGYRLVPASTVTLDLAVYRNQYDRLRTFEMGVPSLAMGATGPYILTPLAFGNGMVGTAQGFEALANWTPFSNWRLATSWSFIDVDLEHVAGSTDQLAAAIEDDSPRHQMQAQSYLSLGRGVELDAAYYGIDRLQNQGVPGYHRFDVRLGWHAYEGLRLSLGVQNLGTGRRREFGSSLGETPTYMGRAAYAQCQWRF